MSLSADEKHMCQALALAKKGMGFVSPNPMVGCVIVKGNKVVATGHHKKFGGAHAEINAVKKCKIENTTIYINLEPCAHHGQTPPCVDQLIKIKPKRVVIGMKDPNKQVNGKSIDKMRQAGIDVEVGVLEKECEELNESFVKYIKTKKPFVVVKSAVTLDGALSFEKGTRSDFSCEESYEKSHELRQLYDAIAIGINTALIDNPRLTTRKKGRSRNPVRVVFDTHLRIRENMKMFEETGRTIIFTGPKINYSKKLRIQKKYKNVDIVEVPFCHFDRSAKRGVEKSDIEKVGTVIDPSTLLYSARDDKNNGHISLEKCLNHLGKQGITSIQVEGGGEIVTSLLNQGLADKLMIVFTPHIAGLPAQVGNPGAPRLFGDNLKKFELKDVELEKVGKDVWMTGYPLFG